MDHNNMLYQMELRLSSSQQLAEGLRGGSHLLTNLRVNGRTDGRTDGRRVIQYPPSATLLRRGTIKGGSYQKSHLINSW